jgi:hypothetical protein
MATHRPQGFSCRPPELPEDGRAVETGSQALSTSGEDNAAHAPKLFRELDRKGKAVRVLAIAFATLHIGATLLGGAIPPIKRIFTPLVGFYSDGLKMANAWGMFGKPPTSTHVAIEAVMPDGRVFTMSTTDPHARPFIDRIRDARIRKFEGKLSEEGDRARIGAPFLDYYCRSATASLGEVRDVRVRNILHETRDDAGNVTREASSAIVFVRRCGEPTAVPRPQIAPPQPRPPQQGGGDM